MTQAHAHISACAPLLAPVLQVLLKLCLTEITGNKINKCCGFTGMLLENANLFSCISMFSIRNLHKESALDLALLSANPRSALEHWHEQHDISTKKQHNLPITRGC